ncbi:MAG: peptidase [Legionellales bacterium]|nr:peptidase [Legionellales bacterium]
MVVANFLALLLSLFLFVVHLSLPDVTYLDNAEYISPLRVYTQDGDLIGEYGNHVFFPATIDEIPQSLIDAFVVTEDQRFYSHNGIDVLGLVRAFKSLWVTGEKYQGASTITMQVARNFFLTSKKTYLRKLQEIILAYKIDHHLTKQEIITLYLNKIYYGHKAYGIKAAAYIYYGKDLAALTLNEMASLASLPKAPSRNNPIDNPVGTQARRDYILSRLSQFNYISHLDYERAIREPVIAHSRGPNITVDAPYVAEMVRQQLFEKYGDDAYKKGLHVITTIQSDMQRNLQDQILFNLLKFPDMHKVSIMGEDYSKRFGEHEPSWVNQLSKERPFSVFLPALVIDNEPVAQIMLPDRQIVFEESVSHLPLDVTPGQLIYLKRIAEEKFSFVKIPEIEVASVVLDSKTGAIMALIGGFDFGRSQYNRVTQAKRQVGSLIKPFLYASALDNGYTLADTINDSPLAMGGEGAWRPKNAGVRFLGPVRLRWALMSSLNLATIRLVNDIGLPTVRSDVARFGFDLADLPDYLSLSLGSNVSTPLDLAAAYATLSNGGLQVTPVLIDRIEDDAGTIIQSYQHADNQRVISEVTAFMINDVLRDTAARGSAKKVASLGRDDLAGKTGSTNEDVWFCGYNADMVSLLWLGYDDHRSLNYFSSEMALPLWVLNFHAISGLVMPAKFIKPAGVISARVNDSTGLLTDSYDDHSVFEYFRSDDKINKPILSDSRDLVSDDFVANVFS